MRPNNNLLFSSFFRLDGARVLAYLTPLADAPTKEQVPYRRLVVKSRGIVVAGDVLKGPGAHKILLLETAPDFDWAESYRAAYVSREYTWKRRVVMTDPVSKVKRDASLADLGTVFAHFEKPEMVTFQGNKETKYRFLTGQDVAVGDLIEGYRVVRVYDAMGVKAVEVE